LFIGGDPSAGSPTDTLLQLSPPRETKNQAHLTARIHPDSTRLA